MGFAGHLWRKDLGSTTFQLFEEFIHKCNFTNSLMLYLVVKLYKVIAFGGKFPPALERMHFVVFSGLGAFNIAMEDVMEMTMMVKNYGIHKDAYNLTSLILIVCKDLMLALTFFDDDWMKFLAP